MSLTFLGDVAVNSNSAEWARSLYDESTTVLKGPELGDKNFLAIPMRRLAQLAWREGDYEKAISLCKESIKVNHEVGARAGVIACVAGFAAIAVGQGKIERAATLMAAVETQLAWIGIRLLYIDRMEYERNLARLHAILDEKTLVKFWEKGKTMSFEDAIAFALEGT